MYVFKFVHNLSLLSLEGKLNDSRDFVVFVAISQAYKKPSINIC